MNLQTLPFFQCHRIKEYKCFIFTHPGGVSVAGTWCISVRNNEEGFYTTSPGCKIWKFECSQIVAAEGFPSGCTGQGNC